MLNKKDNVLDLETILSSLPEKIQSLQVEAALGSSGEINEVSLGDILFFMIDYDEFAFPHFGGFYLIVRKTKKTVILYPISYRIFHENKDGTGVSLLPASSPDEKKLELHRAWVLDSQGVSEEGDDLGLMFKMGKYYGFKWDGRPVLFSKQLNQSYSGADN